MAKKLNSKKIPLFLFLLLVLFYETSFAQPLTGADYLSKPSRVISWQVNVEGLTTVDAVNSSSDNVLKTYKYFDGFGRPLQDIIEGATPAGKDLIQLYSYDGFGRQTKSYLSFEYTSVSTGEPYQDRATAISNQASYYTTGTTAAKIPYDAKPWVQSGVEESPLQRLLKQGSAGNGFQTDEHYKTVNYRASVSGDNVKKWAADGSSAGTYSANELQVTEGTDEGSAVTLVFTDKLGRVVLKRQQVTSTPSWLDTYYIYDLLGNIAWVVPPKAVTKLSSIGGTWNVSSVPNLVFYYVYDYKNRVIEKKVPGADVIYIIYDPLDRVVLVQSGNLRSSNKWLYSKYDASGRVITEGVYTDATHTTRSGMQSYVDGLSCYGSSSTTYYEARTTGTSSYYTNSCFPTSGTEERLYYYYDDYDTDNNGSADFSYSSQGLSGEGPVTAFTRGMPTAINKRIIGTSNWLRTVSFYDKRLNPLQVQSDNQLRALLQDHTTTVIDFAGRLTIKNEYHSTSSIANITVRSDYSYDGMKRLTEVGQVINGSSRVIVARYEYNALGSLVDKKLHSTNGITYLQSVDYRYNIRGQLTSINNSTLTSDGGTTNDESNDLWGMDLLYEQQEYCAPGSCDVEVINNTSNWTGRISAVKWKASVSGGNTDQRAYVYSYDLAGRMTRATYKAYNNSTTGWTRHPNGYNEEVSYDENGNIATMLRKAVITGSVTTIDSMSYDYGTAADNNQLLNMTESGSNSYGYRNFTSSGSGYSYDNNGNLTADAKKGTTITYNELNKPVRITQTATSKYVEYGYDAAGVRLSKTVYDGSTTKTFNYIAGQFYDENNALSYFSMAEGRVRNASGTFTYEYFITDHQGNVRVSFEDNGSGTAVVRQENSYYPFGMAMPGNTIPSSPNKHLYNAGSELQDEFSGIIDYYSTFFREYDPVLGRFNGVDPQASATMELSIYHYSFNDPVNFNDPNGDFGDGGRYEKYRDVNNNWWHFPTTTTGTGFENMVWDSYNGWSYGFEGWGGGPGSTLDLIQQRIQNGVGWSIDATLVTNFWQQTWGTAASGINAVKTNGGYYINFTATKSGNSYEETILMSDDQAEYYIGVSASFSISSESLFIGNNGRHWLESTSIGLGAFDIAWGGKEQLMSLITAPGYHELGYFKFVRGVSKQLFVIQALISSYETIQIARSNAPLATKLKAAGKSVLDIGVAALPLIISGPGGWIIGGLYFLGDITGVNDRIANLFGHQYDASRFLKNGNIKGYMHLSGLIMAGDK